LLLWIAAYHNGRPLDCSSLNLPTAGVPLSGLTAYARSVKDGCMIRILLAAIFLCAASLHAGTSGLLHSFKKVRATDQFWAEGAAIGDFNHDGKMDVVSGAYWYEGPDFKKRHEIYPANASFKRKTADGMDRTIPGVWLPGQGGRLVRKPQEQSGALAAPRHLRRARQ
jgi:hypothetical protein